MTSPNRSVILTGMSKNGGALQGRTVNGFTQVPDALFRADGPRGLTQSDRLVLTYMHVSYPETSLQVSQIALDLEISRVTVMKSLAKLEARGYIKVTKKNGIKSVYDYTPLLDYVSGNVDLTEFTPPVVEKPKPRPKPEPEEVVVEEAEMADPDALTPEQAKQMRAMTDRIKSNFWVPPEDEPAPVPAPPPGSLRWEDMNRLAYAESLRAAKWRGAQLYYPSLGDSVCEDALHGLKDAVYGTGKPTSHVEAWMVIEDHYTNYCRQRATDLHFDQHVESQLRNDAFARYAEQAGSQPVTWQEYMERYYVLKEFREFDEANQ